MDWPEALDLVVARTRHEPYRAACADTHPHHLVWRSRIVAMATGLPAEPVTRPILTSHPAVTVPEVWDLTRAMRACPFWSRRPGCCTGANCALRGGAVVSHLDCFACLKRYG